MELSAELVEWAGSVIGGKVVSVERQGRWRPHYFIEVKRPGGEVVAALVRLPRDPELVAGSAFLSHFDIAHEARVLKALQGTGIPVARYYGFHEGESAILQGRVAGTNDLSGLDDATRSAVLREYIGHLHRLHTLPVDPSALPGIAVPRSAGELAMAKIRYQEQDYRAASASLRPEPLLDFALWWLHASVPDRDEARWVQGDTGPGQFMVNDRRITALIDWELSHLGDPVQDLGVMRMRNMLYLAADSLRDYIDYYAELSGSPVDQRALCYYTVLSCLLSPLGMAATIQDPDASLATMLPRLGWDVTLRRGLCDALCEAYEVEVVAPAIPAAARPVRTDLHRFLVSHLERQCLPVARGDWEDFLLRGAVGVAQSLELSARSGGALNADDLDDLARVLGEPVEDRESGLAAVSELVERDPAGRAVDMLWLFSRMERRREYLWTPLMIAQKSRPFERYYPAKRTITGPSA